MTIPRSQITPHEIIYSFENEHPIGWICKQGCRYCEDDPLDPGVMTAHTAHELIEPVPMQILREATVQEFNACLVAYGVKPRPLNSFQRYFYAVSMD